MLPYERVILIHRVCDTIISQKNLTSSRSHKLLWDTINLFSTFCVILVRSTKLIDDFFFLFFVLVDRKNHNYVVVMPTLLRIYFIFQNSKFRMVLCKQEKCSVSHLDESLGWPRLSCRAFFIIWFFSLSFYLKFSFCLLGFRSIRIHSFVFDRSRLSNLCDHFYLYFFPLCREMVTSTAN